MPIDPTGTTPGLAQNTKAPETVNLKCRNPKCDSITAVVVALPNPAQRLYRCVKCHRPVGLNVGGAVNF